MKKTPFNTLAITSALGLMLGTAACGKQEFVVTSSMTEQQAAGYFHVPAKVDILLVQDDTGSMREVHSEVSRELNSFLKNLQSQGWDYHFATVPLTHERPVTQVQASTYDPNWGSLWQAPYPGATLNNASKVSQSAFTTPEQYTALLSGTEVSTLSSKEEGFYNIWRNLQDSSMKDSGFLRSDALLAVIVVGNGDDTWGAQTCTRSDGYQYICNTSPMETTYELAKSLLLDGSQMKFYAAVSKQDGNCRGSNSFKGTRYMRMATDSGGASYDICSQSVSQILSGIQNHLTQTELTMRTRLAFLPHEPNVDSIHVWRNPGGNASLKVEIPRDISHQNGWDYVGYQSDAYTTEVDNYGKAGITLLNQGSGYAIEFYGSAKLTGYDTVTVKSDPIGAVDSASAR